MSNFRTFQGMQNPNMHFRTFQDPYEPREIYFLAYQKNRLSVSCVVERYRWAHKLRSKFGPIGDHEK